MRTPGRSRSAILPRPLAALAIALAAGLLALAGAASPASANGEGVFAFDDDTYTVQEGASASLTVVRTGGTGAIDINYNVNAGSAQVGVSNGTVSFGADATEATISIATGQDPNDVSEDFTVTLVDPAGDASIGSPGIATVTVLDDDGPPVFSFESDSYDVVEGELATVTVVRGGGTGTEVTVGVDVTGGTAAPGAEFEDPGPPGVLTFDEGVTEQTVVIQTLDNNADEDGNTIELTLMDPSAGTLGEPDTTTITILDIENGVLEFSNAAYAVSEAGPSIAVTVTRSGGTDGEVTVSCATVAGGSATAGADYTAVNAELTFEDGEDEATCTIPITQDALVEGNETVNLALSSPAGESDTTAPILGEQDTAVLTINDDEVMPTIEFSSATYSVDEDGVTATITVTRSGDTSGESTVTWAAAAGGDPAATADSDFEPGGGELTFAAGDTSETFDVTIIDDDAIEEDELVALSLTSPEGAILGDDTATLTIVDDDGAADAITYTLYFRWSLYGWAGEDGADILDLLTTPEAGSAENLDEIVTAMYRWNSVAQGWESWFLVGEVENIPGINHFETLSYGRVYWITINTEGEHAWVVPAGP